MIWSENKFKLIGCDVDGTLVPEGHHQLDSRFAEICKKAKEKDIILCIASGRQYDNLLRLTEDFKENLIYISMNGSAIHEKSTLLTKFNFSGPDPEEICREIDKFPDTEYMIGSLKGLHVNPRKIEYRQEIVTEYPGYIDFIEDYSEIKNIENLIKISLFHPHNAKQFYTHFANKWGELCNITVSGTHWLDFSNGSKGEALKYLTDLKNISLKDTMVLGDNFNDISMFDVAGYKTAMKDSHSAVKETVDQVISDPYSFLLNYLDN